MVALGRGARCYGSVMCLNIVPPGVFPVVLTHDDIASCNRKLDVFQIICDHPISTIFMYIVFTCMKLDGDMECNHVLKSIQHNTLLFVINNVEITVGERFIQMGKRW